MKPKSIEISVNRIIQFRVDGGFTIAAIAGKLHIFGDCLGGTNNGGNPNYKHDCQDCVYLDTEDGHDVYVCWQGGLPTMIGRYGDDGENYITIPVSTVSQISKEDEDICYAAMKAGEKEPPKTDWDKLPKPFRLYRKYDILGILKILRAIYEEKCAKYGLGEEEHET